MMIKTNLKDTLYEQKKKAKAKKTEEPVVAAAPDASPAASDAAAEAPKPKVISPPHEPNANVYTSTS